MNRWTVPRAPTFAYEFSDDAAPLPLPLPLDPPVARHVSELPYLFDLPAATLSRPLTPEQEALAASMRRAWARFAASGDPSTAAVRWPSFGDVRVMSLGPSRPRVETDFVSKHHCAFWAAG